MAKKTTAKKPAAKKTVKVKMLTYQIVGNEHLEINKVYEVSKATAHLWTGKGYAERV